MPNSTRTSVQAVELSHLRTPEARTQFFTILMTSMTGYALKDVTDT